MFQLGQMMVILHITHNAMSKLFSGHSIMSAYPKTRGGQVSSRNQNQKICFLSVKIDIDIIFDCRKMAGILNTTYNGG